MPIGNKGGRTTAGRLFSPPHLEDPEEVEQGGEDEGAPDKEGKNQLPEGGGWCGFLIETERPLAGEHGVGSVEDHPTGQDQAGLAGGDDAGEQDPALPDADPQRGEQGGGQRHHGEGERFGKEGGEQVFPFRQGGEEHPATGDDDGDVGDHGVAGEVLTQPGIFGFTDQIDAGKEQENAGDEGPDGKWIDAEPRQDVGVPGIPRLQVNDAAVEAGGDDPQPQRSPQARNSEQERVDALAARCLDGILMPEGESRTTDDDADE